MPTVLCDPAKRRSHKNAILSELREQQELAMSDMRNPETKPHVRAMLMRSYVEVQRQRNWERMRPAPKPIDVSDLQRAKERRRAERELHGPKIVRVRKSAESSPAPPSANPG